MGRSIVASAAAALFLALTLLSSDATAANTPAADGAAKKSGLRLTTEAKGLNSPTFVTQAPGRRNRSLLFVVEQRGTVRIVKRGKLVRRPFLDLRGKITNEYERGLLSIAFDPGYAKNRRFFAYYTDLEGDVRVSQFRRSAKSKLRASSRDRDVIEVDHPDALGHNGGTVMFGPDGMLYMATGDGNPSCDPGENAQNPNSLLGKLIRIDPLAAGGYAIPADNPFADGLAGAPEVYALGFRNPFRFNFDPPTGTIAIGDVGQHAWEEVNYETLASARGANFGWDALEGTHPLDLNQPHCDTDTPTPIPEASEAPIYEYPHGGENPVCAVTGGVVVRDRKVPQLNGRYLFGDHCDGTLMSFAPAEDSAGPLRRHSRLQAPGSTSYFSDRKGHVYVTTITGKLLRLRG